MDIEQARFNMIEQQIRTWEVLNQDVLDLLNEIHREEFIPESFKELAFADTRIPIGHDQMTMTPKVEARLIQSLNLKEDDEVLEVGTGCGYLTALLGRIVERVKSIDIYPDFISSAETKLNQAGLTNIELESCDAYSLLDTEIKYDAIIFTASLPEMDERFLELLKPDGRLFVVVGHSPAMEACVYTKQGEHHSSESLFETDLPALIGSEQKQTFSF